MLRGRGFWFACAATCALTALVVGLASTASGTDTAASITRAARLQRHPLLETATIDALGGHREANGSVHYDRAWTARSGLDALASHAADEHALTTEDDRRAVDQGLVRAAPGSRCAGGYEVRLASGVSCSHGDDADLAGAPPLFGRAGAPAGPRGAGATTSAAGTCIGDGTSGARVQLAYVRRSNQADRYAATKATMQEWAQTIDQVTMLSARETGGSRRVRWVTDASCVPTVANIVLTSAATDFASMVSGMDDLGYLTANRKFLVAAEMGSYCGLGESVPDERPGADNYNNGNFRALVASVATSCWIDTVAAHELMHTLGAVQDGAPNATQYGHCTDEADIMCYQDGPGTVLRSVCPAAHEDLYDCNHDDYFHTNPPVGTYLKTHWNTANSAFLDATGSSSSPFSPASTSAVGGTGSAVVSWTAPSFDGGSPILGYTVTAAPGGRTWSAGPLATSLTATGLVDGTSYVFSVAAVNKLGVGLEADTSPVTPTPVITTLVDFSASFAVGLGADAAGNAYVGSNGKVVKVAANGTQTTLLGSSPQGGLAEGATAANVFANVVDVALDPVSGEVYFSDSDTNRVWRISAGKVRGVTTTAAGPATPDKITFDSTGNLFVVDDGHAKVWKVTPAGAASVFAGTGVQGTSGDGGAATAATLYHPTGIAADPSGNVYIADEGPDMTSSAAVAGHRIRKVGTGGAISTSMGTGKAYIEPDGKLATQTALPYPRGLAWGNGRLYVGSVGTVRAVGSDGRVATWIGEQGVYDDDGDGGPASRAHVGYVDDVAVAGSRLLVLDLNAQKLRNVAAPGSAPAAVAPGAPFAVVATAGRESATVGWVPPANGGSAITGYTVTASPGGVSKSVPAADSTTSFSGLTAGLSYTFQVKATNAVGPGPATTSNAVVPTARPAYDPFTSWSAFVKQQYADFVGRAPTAAELSAATASLGSGSPTAPDYIWTLANGTAFGGVYGPVARLYFAYFLRVPDLGGLNYWSGKVRTGTKLDVVSQSFASSNEFKTRYGTLTNRQFVETVYLNVLGRPGDAGGITYWTGQLDLKKKNRGQVMTGFSESKEYKRVRAPEIGTILVYRGLLARMPTTAEFTDAVTRLKATAPVTTIADIIAELQALPAYATRVTKLQLVDRNSSLGPMSAERGGLGRRRRSRPCGPRTRGLRSGRPCG